MTAVESICATTQCACHPIGGASRRCLFIKDKIECLCLMIRNIFNKDLNFFAVGCGKPKNPFVGINMEYELSIIREYLFDLFVGVCDL